VFKLYAAYRQPESDAVQTILEGARLSDSQQQAIRQRAEILVKQVRDTRLNQGGLDAFLLQYDLSSEEGIALMCLAEALLRIPDKGTIDKLIADKIGSAHFDKHLGQSRSLFVNSATWALMLTGRILETDNHQTFTGTLKRFLARTSEPLIRQAVTQAMCILGLQFVMGRTIQEAIQRAQKKEAEGYRYSYDMLGEAALTAPDAARYVEAYQKAIHALKESSSKGPYEGPGISVKISAIHPRYDVFAAHRKAEWFAALKAIALSAKEANIGLTVDAEESDRLFLSLELVEGILQDPAFEGWEGFGLAVQAYQKRAPYVIDWLADKARFYKRRLMVRLVKGAYWDTEIKNTQVEGFSDYSVYTRKISTDVSYIACSKKLLVASDCLFAQFATHNALTVATILELAQDTPFEFQCLHGMGDALYDTLVNKVPCRVYAPVGTHEDLLPYLVRRLLENGANSSFVNRIIDEKQPLHTLLQDPREALLSFPDKKHPNIPLPSHLYDKRKNAAGVDWANPGEAIPLTEAVQKALQQFYTASVVGAMQKSAVRDPSCHTRIVGEVSFGTPETVALLMERAQQAFPAWEALGARKRADCLDTFADWLEQEYPTFLALLVREAGKTLQDAIPEIREAVDFCRYYAKEMRVRYSEPLSLEGPTGETNILMMRGRGVMVCISPWNFPLAIFVGQVVSALVAGNTVIAKPAESTNLIAALAVKGLHQAGVPSEVVQLLPGHGKDLGPLLLQHPALAGVLFTGSTATAKRLQRGLAEREGAILPLIAETGGQNAMIVDSSALPEQVVKDAIRSAFYSAGQRCSALRVLYIQADVFAKIVTMLKGAMAELTVSDPLLLSTDIGPVIDKDAQQRLQKHVERMKGEAQLLYQVSLPPEAKEGTFFPPTLFQIEHIRQLPEEVFGPILHVIPFAAQNLPQIIQDIHQTQFGLTFGLHSRIQDTVHTVVNQIHAGNIYVNRNIVGAVVGVQPFGGEGLSGTGPKAGGPHYLSRLMVERVVTTNTTAAGGNASLMSL
jgi:RHH-type proline utilization regulon transcriptional repressor/proline dehydrogenase/delta 1-pyrroline-5-carboxylate dehydrogenase